MNTTRRWFVSVSFTFVAGLVVACAGTTSDEDVGSSAGSSLADVAEEVCVDDGSDVPDPTAVTPADTTKSSGGTSGTSGGTKKPCKCESPNVPPTGGACPPAKPIDRLDVVKCKGPLTKGEPTDYTAPDGTKWNCAGKSPHKPCIPSVKNGGDATHTNHDQDEWHLGNGCCFYKHKTDVRPATCKIPP